MLKRRAAGSSDVGRAREGNEDAFFVDDELGLYIVSDGMGGHAAGEVASATAVESARQAVLARTHVLAAVAAKSQPREALVELAKDAVTEACRRVHEYATSDAGKAGMGCTLTLLIVCGGVAAMAHVGDSRLYIVRGAGVSQLSSDHTVAAELAHSGLIGPEEIALHPYAHVLSRAIGARSAVEIDSLVIELLPGDRLLLCTDGFSNYLKQPPTLVQALSGDDLTAVAKGLVDTANEAGGRDNITVVVVACEAERPQPKRILSIEERYGALSSVFLFEDLDLPLLARLMAVCQTESHESDAVAVEQGQAINELVVVVSGGYDMRRDGLTIGRLEAGDHAGAATLMLPRPARASLVATEPSRLLRLSGKSLHQLVRARQWLGIGLLERLGRQLSEDYEHALEKRAAHGVPGPARERL